MILVRKKNKAIVGHGTDCKGGSCFRAVWKVLLEEVTFLQRPEGKEGVSHAVTWEEPSRRGNSKGEALSQEQAWSDFLIQPTAV